jgi:polar amino acid transport system substrate-binding protein
MPGKSWARESLLCVGSDHLPPLSEKRADGSVWGMRVDTVNFIADHISIAVRHDALPWARAQAMVESGEADMFCAARTPERESYALFTDTRIIPSPIGAYYFQGSPKADQIAQVKTRDDLRGLSVVTYLGNGGAETFYGAADLRMLPTAELALRALVAGRADVFIDGTSFAPWAIKSIGLTDVIKGHALVTPASFDLHVGIRRSHRQAAAMIAQFNAAIIEAWKSGDLGRILAVYS